jgi:hypothetical protein
MTEEILEFRDYGMGVGVFAADRCRIPMTHD